MNKNNTLVHPSFFIPLSAVPISADGTLGFERIAKPDALATTAPMSVGLFGF